MLSCDQFCPGLKVCYNGTTWAAQHQPTDGCYCESFYGYTGPNCTDVGGVAYFLYAKNGIEIVLAIFGALLSIYLIYRLIISSTKKRRIWQDSQTYTLGYILASCSFMALYTWSEILKLAMPDRFGMVTPEGSKIHRMYYSSLFCLSFAVFFGTMASINVSLTWINLLHMTRRLGKDLSRYLQIYKKYAIIAEIMWLVCLIVLTFLNMTDVAVWIAGGIWACIIVGYSIGRGKIVDLLGGVSCVESSNSSWRTVNTSLYIDIIRNINITCLFVIIGAIISLIGGIGSCILTYAIGAREIVTPTSSVTVYHVFDVFVPLGVIFVCYVLLWYSYRNLTRGMPRTKPQTTWSSTESNCRRLNSRGSSDGSFINNPEACLESTSSFQNFSELEKGEHRSVSVA